MKPHTFSLYGTNFVINPLSGEIHIFDDFSFEIFTTEKTKEKVSTDELKNVWEEIKSLNLNCEEEKQITNYSLCTPNSQHFVKALCLHIAHACNLKCSYCFASKATNDNALMSFKVGKSAIDFLIENSGNHYNLDVDFFGGEPLLNFEVIKKIVFYARSKEKQYNKNFRFTLTTNGLLLNDDVINFANKEFENVVLSLDGRAEVHNKTRCNSYDDVVKKLQDFVIKRKGEYYIRGTYTKNNLDFTNDIIHMLNLGFTELALEPVVCGDLTNERLPVLFNEYEKLAKLVYEKNFTFYQFMLNLENGPCLSKRLRGCGCGTEYFAVTPNGKLFPCHQFVSHPEFEVGDVWNGITKSEICNKFTKRNIKTIPKCSSCWAKLWCCGGCSANAFNTNGNIFQPDDFQCELFKKQLECSIWLSSKRSLAE